MEHHEDLWMASARPCGKHSTRRFAQRLLLFRPDARLFCQDGAACERRADPAHAMYEHALPPLPDAFPPVPAGALPPMSHIGPCGTPSAPRARPSALSVHQCRDVWEIGYEPRGADAAAATAAAAAAAAGGDDHERLPPPAGKTILIYVHGFRQRFFRAAAALHHLRALLAASPPPQKQQQQQQQQQQHGAATAAASSGGACVVIGYLWPAHTHKAAYPKARAKASRAGRLLRNIIALLCARGNRVHLVGHSLGCRVALSALSCGGSAAAAQSGACPAVRVSSVALLAPAIAADALSPGGEFASAVLRGSLAAGARVTVFSSRNDAVLRDSFRLGELLHGLVALRPRGCASSVPALGLHGPVDPSAGDGHGPGRALAPCDVEGVDAVDVTETVGGHSPHAWLASPQVAALLRRQLGGGNNF
jgi:hypothetical protein